MSMQEYFMIGLALMFGSLSRVFMWCMGAAYMFTAVAIKHHWWGL